MNHVEDNLSGQITQLRVDIDKRIDGVATRVSNLEAEDKRLIEKTAKLSALGAITKNGVSKKVNLLLVGASPGQTKLTKAADLKIQTEGKEWLVQALKNGGMEMADNGMPGEDDLGEDI